MIGRRRSAALLALVLLTGCEPEISNRPPVARAGDDQLVFRGDSVTLDGSASFDPDDDTLSHTWTFVSGPAAVTPGTGASFTFTPTVPGGYVFALRVEDGTDSVVDVVGVEVRNDLRVAAMVPATGGTLSGRDPVVVHFDASIRPWTLAGSLVVEDVTDPANPVVVLGNVTLDDADRAVVFSPVVDWVDGADYRVTVTTAPRGLDGAPVRAPVTSDFTGLDAAMDLSAPTIVAIDPADASLDRPLSTVVHVYFSEPVDPATVGAAFSLAESAGPARTGTLTLSAGGTHLLFSPADTAPDPDDPQPLTPGASHVVTLAAGVQDLRGNATGNATTSTFTTTANADSEGPRVLWVSPILGADGVSVKLPVVYGLSEPIEPATLAGAATLGTNGGAGVTGTVSTLLGNTVVVLTPDANLRTATRYDARLASTVTDLAGNPMAEDFTSHFVTGFAPPPSVSVLVPDRAPIGSTVVAQIIGEDFLDGAGAFVSGGGVLVTDAQVLAPDTLEATLTIAPNAALGSRSVTVTNPDGQQGTALSVFEVLRRPPVITSVSPNAANRGQTNVLVTVLGSDFQNGAVASIAGSDLTQSATTFVSTSELRFTISVPAGAAVGDRDVTVTNPDGQSVTLPAGFRIRFPAPTVTGMSPNTGGQGQSLASVVISGTNFQTSPALPTVSLGSGILATTVAATSTTVTVNLTIDLNAATGLRAVTVTNADGQAVTRANSFTVFNAPPQVSAVSPALSQGQSNVVVTVNGSSFDCSGAGPQLAIETSGAPSTGVTVGALQPGCTTTSFSRLVSVTGAAAVGLHDARVTNPGGANTVKPAAVTIREEAPTVTSLSVTNGRRKQTLNVTINGTFFQASPTVSFGPDIAVSVGTVTATTIATTITITDAAALGLRSVTVTNVDGQTATLANAFDVRRALPDLVSISPSPVNQQTTFTMTLSGGDFDCTTAPTVAVRRSGAASAGVTVDNTSGTCTATSITRSVQVASTAVVGLHDVRVTNPDGGFDELSSVLQIREEAPTITSLSVTQGRRKGTVSLTINGTYIQNAPTVSFGANIAVSVGAVTNPGTATSNVAVTVSIQDAAALGARAVTLTNPDGQSATLASAFTVQKAAPDLISLSPAIGNQQQTVAVTLTGTDFDCSTGTPPAVSFGDAAITTTVTCPGASVSETSLTVSAAIGAGAVVGTKNVTVTNPDGASDSLTASFTVREEAPTIGSLTVTQGRRKGTLSLTINGAYFLASPTVSFGPNVGVSVGAVVNPGTATSSIPVTLTIENAAALGARNVTVTNSDGQSATATNAFTIQKALPDLLSLAPAVGNQQQTVSVTLSGTDFDCSTGTPPAVSFGDAAITTTVTCPGAGVAETSLTVSAMIGAGAVVGTKSVTVTNPDGGSDALAGSFTVREEAPTVSTLSVVTGRRKGTLSLDIDGSYFLANPVVSFGPNIAVSVGAVVNPGTASSRIPVTLTIENAASLGARSVTVTNSDGQSVTVANAFTVAKALPDLISLAPAVGNQQETVTVTLTGTDFDCSTGTPPAVSFGDAAITTTVTCPGAGAAETSLSVSTVIGAGATVGGHSVTITNPDGGQDTLPASFTVREEAPSITSLSVTTGRRKATLSLTISGAYILANPTISFGADIAVSAGTVVNPGTATSSVPVTITVQNAAALGARGVTITNSDGQSFTAANAFTVQKAAPDVVSLSTTVGNQQTTVATTLSGSDFDCSTGTPPAVSLGDAAIVATVTCPGAGVAESSLSVSLAIGAGATVGPHAVTVTNPDGASDTLAGAFTVREEAPSITSLSVTQGRRKGTLSLTISGAYILANPVISFGADIAVSAGAVSNPGTATSSVPVTITVQNAAALGARNVAITNSDGQSFTAVNAFTVLKAPPDLVSISTASGNQQQTVVTTLSGTDFDCSTGTPPAVSLGDAAITATVTCPGAGVAETSLSVSLAIGAGASVGAHDVTVTNPDGAADALAGAFTVREEAPSITSLSVVQGRRKETLSLTIAGAYILASPIVSFGADIAVSAGAVVNPGTASSSVPVTITIQDAAALGPRSVTVTNSDGQSVTAAAAFDVRKAAPVVAAITPAGGAQGSTVAVSITGDDFDCSGVLPAISFGDLALTVAGVSCPGATVSEDSLSANVTIGAGSTLGLHDVTVTNADGGAGTLANAFDVDEEPPVVTSIDPVSGRRRQTLTVEVTGDFFQNGPAPTVSFGAGVGVSSVTWVDANTLQVSVSVSETAALGMRSVTVTNKDGQSTTFANAFEVERAIPAVVAIAPSVKNQQESFAVTITGDHFDCSGAPGTVPAVSLNDAAVTVSSVSCGGSTSELATTLTANVSIGAGAAVGAHDVTVTNAGDGAGGSGIGLFQVREEAPVVSSLSTTAGRRKQTLSLTIDGAWFLANPIVSFGPNVAVSVGAVVNPGTASSQIPVTITVENAATLGARDVTVTNSDGQFYTLTGAFTVEKALPDLVSLSQTVANQQQSPTITLMGSDFDCSGAPGVKPVVSFGDAAITATVTCPGTGLAESSLSVALSIGAGASVGPHDVTVTNPDGGSDTLSGGFTVREEAPVISTLSVSQGRRKQTLTLTITGEYFLANPTISFGADIAVSAGAVSNPGTTSSSVVVTLTVQNAASLGARDVTITNSDGQSHTASGAFTVQKALPELVSLSQTVANQQQSPTITLTGTDFDCSGAPGVKPNVSFGDAAITTAVTCPGTGVAESSLSVTVTIGAGASVGAHDVTVTNPDGGADVLSGGFTVREEAPTFTSLSVTSGRRKQTLSLTISGEYILANPTVSFGGNIGVSVGTVVNPGTTTSQVPVTISIQPGAALGARDVVVTNSDGQAFTASGAFTVGKAVPDLVSISPSPASGNQQTTVPITLTGTDFDCSGAPPAVSLGDAAITATVTCPGPSDAETSLSVSLAIGAAATLGAHDVTVTNADGASDTLPGVFTVREEAPSAISVLPASGRRKATLSLTIDGDYIQSNPTVSFGSDILVSVGTVTNPGTASSQVPVTITIQDAAALGPRSVTVTNPDGQSFTAAGAFTVEKAAPTIASISPAFGSQGTVVSFTINGDDFDCTGTLPAISFGDLAMNVAGISCPDGSTVSENRLQASVTIGAGSVVGLHGVTVTNVDGGSGTLANGFDVKEEEPIVSALSVSSGRRKDTFDVTITGDFFQNGPAPTVSFGTGVGIASVTFVSANSLVVNVSVADAAALGLRSVTVTNKDGQSDVLTNSFTVLRGVPTVGSVTPNVGSQLQTLNGVTITGTHFDCSQASPPAVSFNDANVVVSAVSCGASTSEFATTLTADVAINASATVGLHAVTVTSPLVAGDAPSGTGVDKFTVREEAPALASAAPNPKQSATSNVTITGNHFQSTPAVPTVSTAAPGVTVNSVAFVSATELTVNLSVDVSTPTGTYALTVTNADGQAVTGNVLTIDAAQTPVVSSVTPSRSQQGTTLGVTIAGSDFQPGTTASQISFGAGITVDSVTSVTPTAISAQITIAAGAAISGRTVGVSTVSTPVSTGTLANGFFVTDVPPTVTSVSPNNGTQGTTVTGLTIAGTNFRAGAVPDFGSGVTVSNVVVTVPNQITCDVTISSTAPPGAHDVTVINTDTSRGTVTGGFTVVSLSGGPVITAVIRDPQRGAATTRVDSANSLRQGQSALFHVTGFNFQSGATVTVSGAGVTVSGVTFVNTQRIDVTLALACGDIAPGPRDVTVSNPLPSTGNGLTGTLTDGFIVRSGIVINELTTSPRVNRVGGGGAEEMLEIFNGSSCTVDLSNWRLDFIDTALTGFEIGSTNTGLELYSAGSTRTAFAPGGYLQINTPDAGGNNLQDNVYVALVSRTGRFVDDVEVGSDEENDGDDGAPAAGNNGASLDANDEMVARCPNGSDSENDIFDFFQSELGTGAPGQAATDRATNNTQCTQCSNGTDDDADGWVDVLDNGCTDPHTDGTEGAGAVTECSDGVDNGDPDALADEADPDCFDAADTSEAS